jgi:hypothetical protein
MKKRADELKVGDKLMRLGLPVIVKAVKHESHPMLSDTVRIEHSHGTLYFAKSHIVEVQD